jgi:carboxyl-terminal processing protease
MEDGSGLKLTIARYFTPSGRSIQEKGINPDYLVGEAEGAAVARPDILREKDLKRHFKGEGEAEPADKLKPNLPATMKAFDASQKLPDFQLKVALDYLNAISGTVPKSTARAAGGN